jgi:glutathione S-transferase
MELDMTGRYRLIGVIGSPYSVKMRAILRYRRIPFDWVQRTLAVMPEVAHIKPQLIPILQYPEDGSYHLDSTLLAYALEKRHPGQRSIVPDDPGLAFLSHLIEDMADEWGTKIMFHYRWFYEADQIYCAEWLARETMGPADEETVASTAKMFRDRQVGRMPLVGCTPENQPLVEETYFRLLDLLEQNLSVSDFLFGSRPSLADFGWFGQLYQSTFDPTPMALMRKRAVRTYQWVQRLDDASGSTSPSSARTRRRWPPGPSASPSRRSASATSRGRSSTRPSASAGSGRNWPPSPASRASAWSGPSRRPAAGSPY